jgi:hypothetical protein
MCEQLTNRLSDTSAVQKIVYVGLRFSTENGKRAKNVEITAQLT